VGGVASKDVGIMAGDFGGGVLALFKISFEVSEVDVETVDMFGVVISI